MPAPAFLQGMQHMPAAGRPQAGRRRLAQPQWPVLMPGVFRRFMPFIDMHRKKHSELRAWKRGTLLVFPKL